MWVYYIYICGYIIFIYSGSPMGFGRPTTSYPIKAVNTFVFVWKSYRKFVQISNIKYRFSFKLFYFGGCPGGHLRGILTLKGERPTPSSIR